MITCYLKNRSLDIGMYDRAFSISHSHWPLKQTLPTYAWIFNLCNWNQHLVFTIVNQIIVIISCMLIDDVNQGVIKLMNQLLSYATYCELLTTDWADWNFKGVYKSLLGGRSSLSKNFFNRYRLVKKLKCDLALFPRTKKASYAGNQSVLWLSRCLLSKMICSMQYLVDSLVWTIKLYLEHVSVVSDILWGTSHKFI